MSEAEALAAPKTIFCDIDGVILKHRPPTDMTMFNQDVLPGVHAAFAKWCEEGHTIVLTTGRPDSLRSFTETQLSEQGLYFHHLIMGLPRGPRVVINDKKLSGTQLMALGISVERDVGLVNVNV